MGAAADGTPRMELSEQIRELWQLCQDGALTAEEFADAKAAAIQRWRGEGA